jgi:hypothetical protein
MTGGSARQFHAPHAARERCLRSHVRHRICCKRITLWMNSFQVIPVAIDVMCTMLRRARNRFAD